jgi:basic membrane protein A
MNSKLWLAALAAALIGIVGCGGDSSTTTTNGPDSKGKPGEKKLVIGMVFDSGGPNDKSFNQSANAGLTRAEQEFGVEGKRVESQKESDYETNLDSLAEQNVDLIIAVGISMQKAVEKAAPKHPNIKFALVDAAVDAPNVRGLSFKEEEGSFLVGYLAGLMTKTNKVGFVGGQEIPLIKKFEFGYMAGVKTANIHADVLPAKYTGSWTDADTGKQCAKTLYSQGADIVYHASGACGRGVFEAAKEENKFAIGVDSDQDYLQEGRILTSMIKHVDEAVYQTIKDVKEGKFSPGAKIYDLKANGVGVSEMKYTKDVVGAENLKKLDDVKAKIISGEIKPPATADEYAKFTAVDKPVK